MKTERIIFSEERNVFLDAYIQDVGGKFVFDARPAIVVIPGGAYAYCSVREAEPIAFEYLKAGYHVFVLNYTIKFKGSWPDPLNDYEQAMEYILENSEKWHVLKDKIAVVGFSAGGHLAASAATMANHKPAAAILGYPALRREVIDMCMDSLPSPIDHVDYHTAPCFLFGCRDDMLVPTENILDFEQALCKYGIQFESHVYSYGKHGFSSGEKWLNSEPLSERAHNWLYDSIGWLAELFGTFTINGFTEPQIKRSLNSNAEDHLSADCSMGYLFEHDTKELLKPIYEGLENAGKERNIPLEKMVSGFRVYTLRELMHELNLSEEQIEYFDSELKKIRNQ